jgi:hypothetical protein
MASASRASYLRRVIAEFAQLLKLYNVTEIQGDKYAIGFHEAEWRSHGIRFIACERTTSENYLHALPLLLAGRLRLIDNMTLRSQLSALERRVGAGDRETISHPQHASAHDDVATAECGALVAAATRPAYNLDALADGSAFWNTLRWANYFHSCGLPWP